MNINTPAEQLLFSTVRIETISSSGQCTGTAFIFNYTWNEKTALFLVTNKHVVAGASSGRFFFTLREGANPMIGQRFDINIENFENQWYGHKSDDIDLTIMPLLPLLQLIEKMGKEVFYCSIPHNIIPTQEQIDGLDVLEEVIFIGYPSGMFDKKNLLPIMRRGTTATPVQIDYEGNPIFLVDASVFPGSSGSPVFICNCGSYSDKKGNIILGSSRLFFLGVIAQVVTRIEYGEIKLMPIPTLQIPITETQQMIDLGIVYKSSAVIEVVQDFLKTNNEIE